MLGLRHRVHVAGIERSGKAEAAADLGGEIGENVAEHVGGDDHVERGGIAHEQRSHGIDDALLVLHAG